MGKHLIETLGYVKPPGIVSSLNTAWTFLQKLCLIIIKKEKICIWKQKRWHYGIEKNAELNFKEAESKEFEKISAWS